MIYDVEMEKNRLPRFVAIYLNSETRSSFFSRASLEPPRRFHLSHLKMERNKSATVNCKLLGSNEGDDSATCVVIKQDFICKFRSTKEIESLERDHFLI